MYMKFKSVEILVKSFFVSKIEQFYLVLDYFVLDFFDRIILFLIYAIFLQLEESKTLILIRLNFFNIIFCSEEKLKTSFFFLTVHTSFWTFFGQIIKHNT